MANSTPRPPHYPTRVPCHPYFSPCDTPGATWAPNPPGTQVGRFLCWLGALMRRRASWVPCARKEPRLPLWDPLCPQTPTAEPGQPMIRQEVSLLCDLKASHSTCLCSETTQLLPGRMKCSVTSIPA